MESNEVEIELDSFHLKRNLEAKMAGKPHKLWELLSDFLFTARDLAVIAAEVRPIQLPVVLDPLPAEVVDDNARAAYKSAYIGMAEPLIGHYMYRLAKPRAEPLPLASVELQLSEPNPVPAAQVASSAPTRSAMQGSSTGAKRPAPSDTFFGPEAYPVAKSAKPFVDMRAADGHAEDSMVDDSSDDENQVGTAQQVGWNEHTRAVGELLGLD